MGTHPIFESDFDCLTECHLFPTRMLNSTQKQRLLLNMKISLSLLLRFKLATHISSAALMESCYKLRIKSKDYSKKPKWFLRRLISIRNCLMPLATLKKYLEKCTIFIKKTKTIQNIGRC